MWFTIICSSYWTFLACLSLFYYTVWSLVWSVRTFGSHIKSLLKHPIHLVSLCELSSALWLGPLTHASWGKRPLSGCRPFLDLRELFPHYPITVAEPGVPQPSGLHQRGRSAQINFMREWRKVKLSGREHKDVYHSISDDRVTKCIRQLTSMVIFLTP